ncbi:MAG: CPBP family intramembrane metalloprotease [Colwellia sp.]
MTNKAQASESTSEQQNNKITIIGTIFLFILLMIFSSLLQLVLAIPMFFTDMLSLEMFNLPNDEFFDMVGINGITLIKLLELISIILCINLFLKKDHIKFSSLGLKFKTYETDALLGALAGIIVMSICFIFLVSANQISFIIKDSSEFPWGYLIFFLLVAIYEEILFRGYIQSRLMRATNPYLALLISSIIFMILHLANENWTILSLINLTLAGILFGVYYLYKQNLWFPIALHFTWNFFQGPIYGFEVSGTTTSSWISITKTGNPLITGGDFGLEGSILITIFELLLIIFIYLKLKKSKCNIDIAIAT